MSGCSDDSHPRSLGLPPRPLHRRCHRRARKPRAPPSTRGPSALRAPTPALPLGSTPLGLVVPPLGRLADHPRHRPARHRSGVAPPRRPALLAVEVQAEPGRPPAARRRASHSHPAHGSRESHLGAPAHPSGTRPARLRGRRADRRQVHAPDFASTLAHVAGLSRHACPRHRRRRLLSRANPDSAQSTPWIIISKDIIHPPSSRRTRSRSNPAPLGARIISATCFFVRSCGPCPGKVILTPCLSY